jgi:hypothetical protein
VHTNALGQQTQGAGSLIQHGKETNPPLSLIPLGAFLLGEVERLGIGSEAVPGVSIDTLNSGMSVVDDERSATL